MAVNSLKFLLFFIVVFFLYYFPCGKLKAQNVLLLLASYVFYGLANWKMIPLLLAATAAFYSLGLLLGKVRASSANVQKTEAAVMAAGVCLGAGMLLYFKYFNFFIVSFQRLFAALGLHTGRGTLNIMVPFGISYFTFKLISYIIEIYRNNREPEKNIIIFAVYTVFFPTVTAGPIDRPCLIDQLQKARSFDYELAVDGCRQILWGLFKKQIIANTFGVWVNAVWNNIGETSSIILIITALLFTIQLYADFSGYSDIAIGIGKLLNFRITSNFNYPFFGRNIAEFWRNWHISLTSWLTDYVFMPLNVQFRNLKKAGIILAIIINFVLVGLWHGADWTFAAFGLYHSFLYIPLILSGKFQKRNKLNLSKFGLPSIKDFAGMIFVFILVSIGNILFRAAGITEAFEYIKGIGRMSFNIYFPAETSKLDLLAALGCAGGMFIMEWHSYLQKNEGAFQLQKLKLFSNAALRRAFYLAAALLLVLFSGNPARFLYAQF